MVESKLFLEVEESPELVSQTFSDTELAANCC